MIQFLPIVLVITFILGIILSILYLFNSWVTKYLNLKRQQNEVLREIADRMNR